MARHRDVEGGSPPMDVRAHLIQRALRPRPKAIDPALMHVPVNPNPPPTLLEQLEAGEAVEVDGWRLPRPNRFAMYDRVRVEGDGTVTLVRSEAAVRREWAAIERARMETMVRTKGGHDDR